MHIIGVLYFQLEVREEVQLFNLHCVDIQILWLIPAEQIYKNTAVIRDRLRIRNDVHQGLEQGDFLNGLHLESIHIVPDY